MRGKAWAVALVVLMGVGAAGAEAQAPAVEAATSPLLMARVDRFPAAEQALVAVAQPGVAVQTRRSVALMIVGGALLLAGAVVDGDPGTVLMVSGVVIGAYGLYLYLM